MYIFLSGRKGKSKNFRVKNIIDRNNTVDSTLKNKKKKSNFNINYYKSKNYKIKDLKSVPNINNKDINILIWQKFQKIFRSF